MKIIKTRKDYKIQKSGLADQKRKKEIFNSGQKKYSILGDDGILVKILTNDFYLNL
jgi:hypothetical protein